MASVLNVEGFCNIENLLSPYNYSRHYDRPFSQSLDVAVPVAIRTQTQTRLSRECEWGYTFSGPQLRCFPLSSTIHVPSSDRTYMSIPRISYCFPNTIIKCVEEICVAQELSSIPLPHLILGLDSGVAGGYIVIFDVSKGHPVRWIRTPSPVESIVAITKLKDEGYPSPFGSVSILGKINGIVAAGLAGGRLILQDLGLDNLEVSSENDVTDCSQPLEYENTFDVVNVNPTEDDIEIKRLELLEHRQLICVDLTRHEFCNEDYDENEAIFDYLGPRGELIRRFRTSEVSITALHYVPAIGSILVGFNFGGFQIWHLQNLRLCHSVPFKSGQLPVLAFEFQTPLDDPRNFCYVWVLSGHKTGERTPATIQLLALEYTYLTNINEYQPFYTELRSCVQRLEFNLGNTHSTEKEMPEKVRPIRFSVFQQIMYVCWETMKSAYMGLFDLDQWYSAQTIANVPIQNSHKLCPFWAAICFQGPGGHSLCDVRLNTSSFQQWTNIHAFDPIHLYPASNSFEAIGLTAEGSFVVEYLGIQEQALRLIQNDGIHLMAQPSQLIRVCRFVGLNHCQPPTYPANLPQKIIDQFWILSTLLEAARPAVIIQLANAWLDGSFENLGLNLHLIMEWAHHYADGIRRITLQHWDSLLCSNSQSACISPEAIKFLHFSHFVWMQQKALLWTLLRGIQDVQDCYYELHFGLEKLAQYSGALLILSRANILPVSKRDDDFTEAQIAYYMKRRVHVQRALNNCQWINPQERGGHTLLVDYLFEHFEEDALHEDMSVRKENHFYPPRHPKNILNLILETWVDVPPNFISRVLFYYMLDILESTDHWDEIGGEFETVVDLSPDERAKVEILWMIDHGNLEGALSRLSLIHLDDEEEVFPWSAALVILAAQGLQVPVLNILSSGPYSAKISRFALSLALDVEYQSLQLRHKGVIAFSNNQSTFYQLLRAAEEINSFDPFILTGIWKENSHVQCEVEEYLRNLPFSFSNQVRLFRFYVFTARVTESVAIYNNLLKVCNDRNNLPSDTRIAFERAEAALRQLLVCKNGLWKAFLKRATKNEQSQKELSPGNMHLDSPQTSDGVTALSPLKRYRGRSTRRSDTGASFSKGNAVAGEDDESGDEVFGHLLGSLPRRSTQKQIDSEICKTIKESNVPQRSSIKKKGKVPLPLRNQLLRTRFLEVVALSPITQHPKPCDSGQIYSDSSPSSGSTDPFSVHGSGSPSDDPDSDDMTSECEEPDLCSVGLMVPTVPKIMTTLANVEDMEVSELEHLEGMDQGGAALDRASLPDNSALDVDVVEDSSKTDELSPQTPPESHYQNPRQDVATENSIAPVQDSINVQSAGKLDTPEADNFEGLNQGGAVSEGCSLQDNSSVDVDVNKDSSKVDELTPTMLPESGYHDPHRDVNIEQQYMVTEVQDSSNVVPTGMWDTPVVENLEVLNQGGVVADGCNLTDNFPVDVDSGADSSKTDESSQRMPPESGYHYPHQEITTQHQHLVGQVQESTNLESMNNIDSSGNKDKQCVEVESISDSVIVSYNFQTTPPPSSDKPNIQGVVRDDDAMPDPVGSLSDVSVDCFDPTLQLKKGRKRTRRSLSTSLDSCSPTKRSSVEVDPNSSFGMVTRSRARHMSDASFLEENLRTFVNQSANTVQESPVSRSLRAQSEPTRRKSTRTGITRRKTSGSGRVAAPPLPEIRLSMSPGETCNESPFASEVRKEYTSLEHSLDESDYPSPSLLNESDALVRSQSMIEFSERKSKDGRRCRSKSEEPATKPDADRRKSNRSAADASISESTTTRDSLVETDVEPDTSVDNHSRLVFDYRPRLSTVLEVTETESPINIPMTRSRRRSLNTSSMLSIEENVDTTKQTGILQQNPIPSVAPKRKRRTVSASASVETIAEEENPNQGSRIPIAQKPA